MEQKNLSKYVVDCSKKSLDLETMQKAFNELKLNQYQEPIWKTNSVLILTSVILIFTSYKIGQANGI